MADKDKERPIIIVKKTKKVAGGHHGGAWKVAYADFVTAMMAFFLVMWLVTAVSKEQRAAIFEYFKNPSMEPGKSVKPAPGQTGPGGASTSPINLGGGLDAPRTTESQKKPGIGTPVALINRAKPEGLLTPEEKAELEKKIAAELKAAKEKERLDALMKDLREAVSKSQALEPFKDQLLLDITPEGLRIQIVDAQNRPMFDIGSSRLKGYTNDILHELTPYLNSVPNHISLTGHTDLTAYAGITGYTNWDLSTDRANAARRSLESAGLSSDKVSRVVGLSSSVLFDKQNPRNPINRRISIIVMTTEAELEANKTEQPDILNNKESAPVAGVSITGSEGAAPALADAAKAAAPTAATSAPAATTAPASTAPAPAATTPTATAGASLKPTAPAANSSAAAAKKATAAQNAAAIAAAKSAVARPAPAAKKPATAAADPR